MTAPEKTTRRSKRSRVAPIALLGAAAFAISACKEEEKVATTVFPDKAACETAASDPNSWWTKEECDKAFAEAQAEHARSAPRYADQKLCEEEHGGQCYVEQRSDGSSVFLPLMMGYMMGNMMNSGSNYHPQPIYKTRSGKYSTASGAALLSSNRGTAKMTTTSFRSATPTVKSAPMTRTTVKSSGGFGASRTSYSSSSRSTFSSRSSFGG